MFTPSSNTRVYLALGSTDMRKSINTLSIIVETNFELNPLTGHMFAFTNKNRSILKVLWWDRNGFCLLQKRLEKEKFKWPSSQLEIKELDYHEFQWLISGLDIQKTRGHKSLKYTSVC